MVEHRGWARAWSRPGAAIAPTPKETLLRDGTASLYRFHREGGERGERSSTLPLLLVPSLINRWYVLDLRRGASLVGALVDAGLDTWCLDWGVAEDEDRYLGWSDLAARLARAARAVARISGAPRVGLLGYSSGATLAGIHAALHPDGVAALVNLAGPFDFERAGFLREMVDPRFFDADAVAEAGNLSPLQMQSGFFALRPTEPIAKLLIRLNPFTDRDTRDGLAARAQWAREGVPFPGAAYATYIRELYQQNQLVEGKHHVGGRRVDLGQIRCPLLTVVAEEDTTCPAAAATALNARCGSQDREVLTVPGGHVGAVVGPKAKTALYPALASWLTTRLA